MAGEKDTRLEVALGIVDPEERCLALIRLIPDLNELRAFEAISAVRNALEEVRKEDLREQLRQRLSSVMLGSGLLWRDFFRWDAADDEQFAAEAPPDDAALAIEDEEAPDRAVWAAVWAREDDPDWPDDPDERLIKPLPNDPLSPDPRRGRPIRAERFIKPLPIDPPPPASMRAVESPRRAVALPAEPAIRERPSLPREAPGAERVERAAEPAIRERPSLRARPRRKATREPRMVKPAARRPTRRDVTVPRTPDPSTLVKPAARSRPTRRASARPFVNLGFANRGKPATPLSPRRSLTAGADYWFWVEMGERLRGSAAGARARLDLERLPSEIDLTVVLFTNPRGIAVRERTGRLHIHTDHSIRVARQPASSRRRPRVRAELLRRRLFFAVTAPTVPGTYRMRCCLYARGVLVQSHDVKVTVEARGRAGASARVSATLDYTLSSSFAPEALAVHGEHRLSVLLNSDGHGTHSFRFFAPAGEFVQDASFNGGEVQDLIDRARRALRMVSWGSEALWSAGSGPEPSERHDYRYAQPAQLAQLTTDLARLAIAGYRNYDALVDRIGSDDLIALMRRPGIVQLALKEHASHILPIALLYDHRLDVDGRLESYTLCEQFVREQGRLANSTCLGGDCPYRDRDRNRVVCPSGFWGFRHEIGVPPTLGTGAATSGDLPGILECGADPLVLVAVSTDADMELRDQHVRQLRNGLGATSILYADTREQTLTLLRDAHAHIVYLYGHGGVDDGAPYMQVGAPSERISRATLRSEKVRWTAPRSLVFLNGCHTTDLEPERAIDLVSGFVQTARGSGVIGTEITVFEPLATQFAEICLAEIAARRSVGAAVRAARLHLLQDQWNPLGLVYIPYAIATLRLSPRT